MADQPLKINIGSGNEVLDGYKSVDLFVPADIKDDITKLDTFSDSTVDEVRTYHLLEHLRDPDVPIAIKQVYRVLKKYGKWTIEVPDFIWLIDDFLSTPESGRWGWKIQTIFGMQCNDGEYHKTGFSRNRLYTMLVNGGFGNVTVEERFSKKYNQGVLDAVAYKL